MGRFGQAVGAPVVVQGVNCPGSRLRQGSCRVWEASLSLASTSILWRIEGSLEQNYLDAASAGENVLQRQIRACIG